MCTFTSYWYSERLYSDDRGEQIVELCILNLKTWTCLWQTTQLALSQVGTACSTVAQNLQSYVYHAGHLGETPPDLTLKGIYKNSFFLLWDAKLQTSSDMYLSVCLHVRSASIFFMWVIQIIEVTSNGVSIHLCKAFTYVTLQKQPQLWFDLASFPGPAQLFVAFLINSNGKLGGAWKLRLGLTNNLSSNHFSLPPFASPYIQKLPPSSSTAVVPSM